MSDLLPVSSTRNFFNTFRIKVITQNGPQVHVRTVEVVVQTDSIRIYHIQPYKSQWTTLEPTATVLDVLRAFQHQDTWHSCTLSLSPPSNVASPMVASGDWVDMGDSRMECENFDTMSIPMNDSMMKLNPNAIHGGVFVIRLK